MSSSSDCTTVCEMWVDDLRRFAAGTAAAAAPWSSSASSESSNGSSSSSSEDDSSSSSSAATGKFSGRSRLLSTTYLSNARPAFSSSLRHPLSSSHYVAATTKNLHEVRNSNHSHEHTLRKREESEARDNCTRILVLLLPLLNPAASSHNDRLPNLLLLTKHSLGLALGPLESYVAHRCHAR